MARIDLDTLATRDTQSQYTSNNTWPANVTDLTYDGRYYYYTINSEPSGPQDTIYRVDMEPGAGPYGQAPSIDAIAFSAASLPNDAATMITLTASASDPQGADQIAGVWSIPLAEGVEKASWWTDGAPLTMSAGQMSDDGTTLGDQAAGDGVYTNDMRTSAGTNVYEHYGLPYDVGVRIIAADVDGNYTIADTVLTVTE